MSSISVFGPRPVPENGHSTRVLAEKLFSSISLDSSSESELWAQKGHPKWSSPRVLTTKKIFLLKLFPTESLLFQYLDLSQSPKMVTWHSTSQAIYIFSLSQLKLHIRHLTCMPHKVRIRMSVTRLCPQSRGNLMVISNVGLKVIFKNRTRCWPWPQGRNPKVGLGDNLDLKVIQKIDLEPCTLRLSGL